MNLFVYENYASLKKKIPSDDVTLSLVMFEDFKFKGFVDKKYINKIKFFCDEKVRYLLIDNIPFEVTNNVVDFGDYVIDAKFLSERTLTIEMFNYTSEDLKKITVGFY